MKPKSASLVVAGRSESRRSKATTLRRSKIALTLFAALSSGSLAVSCETRFKDAAVDATRQYILGLLDPANLVDLLVDENTGEIED